VLAVVMCDHPLVGPSICVVSSIGSRRTTIGTGAVYKKEEHMEITMLSLFQHLQVR
jgi:hypothetical protein